MQNKIQIFEKQPIRAIWDGESEIVTNCNDLKIPAPKIKMLMGKKFSIFGKTNNLHLLQI